MRTALVPLNVCHTNVAVSHGPAGRFGRAGWLAGRAGRFGGQGKLTGLAAAQIVVQGQQAHQLKRLQFNSTQCRAGLPSPGHQSVMMQFLTF